MGGLDLAAEMAGIKTVGQCEYADYPRAVLAKHWPHVPKWQDIRTLTKESFHEQTGRNTITVLSGGFPCQPFSLAGKRGGTVDDRYLWPEMLRVIQQLKPSWVVSENVPGIVTMALDTVLSDLEASGYEAQCFLIPACGVNAPHKRARCAIVAHTIDRSRTVWWHRKPQSTTENGEYWDHHYRGTTRAFQRQWWSDEPGVPRVAHGVPNRMDRIKCLGNAVVPQQFYPIFRAIADIEAMINNT